MPETPEMEIYENYLNKWVKDQRIIEINVLRAKSINLDSSVFCQQLKGKVIQNITLTQGNVVHCKGTEVFSLTNTGMEDMSCFMYTCSKSFARLFN